MDAVTYPDEKVAAYIDRNYIPLRIASDAEPYSTDFMVQWTPRTIVVDSFGSIHQSEVGFFPPENFIPALELGLAKTAFDEDRLDACTKHLATILTDYPNSAAAPEAVYLQGVTNYKTTHQAGPLKDAYNSLKDTYPNSEWVTRALPYRLL